MGRHREQVDARPLLPGVPDLGDLMHEAPVAPLTAARLFRRHFGASVTEYASPTRGMTLSFSPLNGV